MRTFRPGCMTPNELAFWTEANRSTFAGARAVRPCADCLTSWASEMAEVCNGRPGGRALGAPARRVTAHRKAKQAEYARAHRARMRERAA